MIEAKINALERVRYWQGQLLMADDLQTQIRVDLELRRQHDRSAHHAYGIAVGLGLTKETEAVLEDGAVTIPCGGIAYDCAGHALRVGGLTKAIPENATEGETLVLSYDPGNPAGVTVNWKSASEVNPNVDVAILRLTLKSGNPDFDQTFQPVVARPMARPRLATGVTIPGQTAWETWTEDGTEIGVKVAIDTSAAGFTEFLPSDAPINSPKVRAPHYFAEVIASRLNNDPGYDPTRQFVPAWFASIADPSNQGFTLQLMLRQITRANLDIASPVRMVIAAPELNQPITLAADPQNEFKTNDQVSRILPLAEQASPITSINNTSKVITLDTALESGTVPRMVAFGNAPRIATVTDVAQAQKFFEVTVADATVFDANSVVAKLGNTALSSPPARVAAVDEDGGVLALVTAIPGLGAGDELGLVDHQSNVTKLNGVKVNVADPSGFAIGTVVVRLGDGMENFMPLRVTDKAADGTLTLSSAIAPAAEIVLGAVASGSTVDEVNNSATEIEVDVVDVKMFRKFDIVAKQLGSGAFSVPARIERINKSKNQLFLSGVIPGLAKGDTIVAANYLSRGTVISVSENVVRVVDVNPFPKDSKIVSIDELLAASSPVSVTKVDNSASTLTLSEVIPDLDPGNVIGLCAFPVSVAVNEVLPNNGGIVVSDANLLRQGDLLAALPDHSGVAVVTESTGNVIKLSPMIQNLAAGDHLGVVAMGGVVTATDISGNKVTVDLPKRLRAGDFLAEIKGFSQAELRSATTAFVSTVNGNNITLTSTVDGLLLDDLIGLANLNPKAPLVRLKTAHDIQNGDEALLFGRDRRRGTTVSTSVSILVLSKTDNLFVLFPQTSLHDSILRPEDISVGLLFVRGPALALIKDYDLYVSWLAVGASDPRPGPCLEGTQPEAECIAAKE